VVARAVHRLRARDTVQFNPRFLAFAGHYLFEATAAPVRYPEYKGRVEASIKYIRSSFYYGRAFASFDDLRAQAAAWRDQTANQRLHATTREPTPPTPEPPVTVARVLDALDRVALEALPDAVTDPPILAGVLRLLDGATVLRAQLGIERRPVVDRADAAGEIHIHLAEAARVMKVKAAA
jgi:hypothetical protein